MISFFSDFSIAIIAVMGLIFLLYFTNISSRAYIVISLIFLSVLAFFVNPMNGYTQYGDYIDLFRFYRELNIFTYGGWNASFPTYLTPYETVPVMKAFVYIISITRIYGLLPLSACLIGYGIFGKQLLLIKADYSLNDRTIKYIFFLFIALTNYTNIISNIRMPVGLTLFSYIFYLDVRKKAKPIMCLIGYILLSGIHSIFILFLGLRILLFFANKYSLLFICALSILGGAAINFINISSIMSILGNSNPLTSLIFDKISYYSETSVSQHEDNLYLLMAYLKIFLLILSLYKVHKLKINTTPIEKNFYYFSIIILSFSVGAIWNFHFFTRMCNFIPYLVLLWFAIIKSKNSYIIKQRRGIFSIYELSCTAICICTLFYLCLSHNYRMLHF